MYLHGVGNYTQYLIDLIDRDRLDRLDSTFIDNKIKEHQGAIKELQDLKKQKPQIGNYQDIISDFKNDPEAPQISDYLSKNICFKYFKTKYWPRIKNIPEYKLRNPVDVFNEILEKK